MVWQQGSRYAQWSVFGIMRRMMHLKAERCGG